MGFTLEEVVPWGRSCDEYCAMFALERRDLGRRVLGCGDGPAAFNAGWTARGGYVLSADPLYVFDAASIAARIAQTCEAVMIQLGAHADDYCWRDVPDVASLGKRRMRAMEAFLRDYQSGRHEGRYLAAALPALPLRDRSFDLALCSHLLFLYGAHLDRDFHLAAIREMLRVAAEVRVFPLLGLDGTPSPHLAPTLARLRAEGHAATVRRVDYEFQKGGNEMLEILRAGSPGR